MSQPLETAGSLRAQRAVAFLLPVIFLIPFAGKPYQADDHVFIWVAEQIAKHPLDFFGFDVDYGVEKVPIHMVNHNPPAVQYWLALVGVLTNWHIVALHLAMTVFAGLAALGVFELARDFRAPPGWAAALSTLTPAFLVSSSTLMTDTALLAAYVWAIVGWRRGFERGSQRWIAFAMLCAALAPWTKFFGISLIPLLFLDGLLRAPRPRLWWLWLVVPCASFGAFQFYMQIMYGVTSLSAAANVALAEKWRMGETSATRPLLAVVFIGGSMLPLAVPAAIRAGRRATLIVAAIAIAMCVPLMGGYSIAQLLVGDTTAYASSELLHLAGFLIAGTMIVFGSARALGGYKRADLVLLAGWLAGTMVFTIFVNHYIAVRTILPMLPAFVILLAPALENIRSRAATFAGGAILCGWLLIGDYDVAAHDLRAANRAVAIAKKENKPLYYVAFWGFEYHLMKAGAHPLAFAEKKSMADPTQPQMNTGDLVVVDAYASAPWNPPPKGFEVIERFAEHYTAGATTFDAHAAAGFYSHRIGVLPFRIGRIAPEEFLVMRWSGR